MRDLLAGLTKEKGTAAIDSAFSVYSSHWGSVPEQDVVKKTVVDIETDFLFLVPTQLALQLHANNTRSVVNGSSQWQLIQMKIQLRLINQTPCDLTLFTWLVPQWSAHILVPLQHEDSYPRISSLGGGRARRRPAVPVRKTLLHPAGLLPPTPRPVALHDCILDQLRQDWVIFQHALQRHSTSYLPDQCCLNILSAALQWSELDYSLTSSIQVQLV